MRSRQLKKEDSAYFLEADIDGQPFRWEGIEDYVHEVRATLLTGAYPSINISIQRSEHDYFFVGTDGLYTGGTGNYPVLGAYVKSSRFVEYASGLYNSSGQPTNGKFEITKATETVMEGEFSFDVYSDKGHGTSKISVTNGRFRLKY
ncbi:hypothetical protein [Dyadobacter sp. SG02]|uniref:hypothetical protein n=1 Tax=Dyadobacter sp. SG02 TaxID=1855291 RepID=UPI00115FBE94|nr:hypothetical protein [Dyadobacter sp. SG02]